MSSRLSEVKQAVADLAAIIYPENMRQMILDNFLKAPNAGDPSYWENLRQGLAIQAVRLFGKRRRQCRHHCFNRSISV